MSGGAQGVALFHAVLAGRAIATLPDGGVHILQASDLMVLPRGGAHVVGSESDLAPTPLGQAVRSDGEFARLVSDGSGEATRLICGTFLVPELDTHPLLSRLPDVVVVRDRDVGWLGDTLIALDSQLEQRVPGARAVVDRLTEILFVQAVATWLTGADQDTQLHAFADPQISRALAAMYADPGAAWSVEALASEAAMSRASFYRRFTEVLGEPPAGYLKQWRMNLAARWLREGDRGVGTIGAELGYSGAPAFSRAFKEAFGVSPTVYRSQCA